MNTVLSRRTDDGRQQGERVALPLQASLGDDERPEAHLRTSRIPVRPRQVASLDSRTWGDPEASALKSDFRGENGCPRITAVAADARQSCGARLADESFAEIAARP
jgi:hypothetical protein